MNSAPFVVHASEGRVDGWATSPLPFEPKGPMLAYRQALREALGRLAPGRGQTLAAVFASADARRCDVENLLVYNLGVSAFAHLNLDDVVLARSWDPPSPPGGVPTTLTHHHGYELTGGQPPAPRCGERAIAHLAPTPLRLPLRIERVWYDIRSNGRVVAGGFASEAERLTVSLTIHRPQGASRPALLGMVKVVVDGFVCTLHRHDGTALDMVAQRLGAGSARAQSASVNSSSPTPSRRWVCAGSCGHSATSSSGTQPTTASSASTSRHSRRLSGSSAAR